MSEVMIKSLQDVSFIGRTDEVVSQMREIFFEASTKKDFKNEEEKKAFEWKYFGFYLANYPEYVLVAWDGRVLGYVLGMPFSNDPSLFEIQPHMKLFVDEFVEYPAHLHINCHVDARGKGVGSKLVSAFERLISEGLHIMTSPNSSNRHFYMSLGFNDKVSRSFQESEIMLFGKKLQFGCS